jgi:hypothetical protein
LWIYYWEGDYINGNWQVPTNYQWQHNPYSSGNTSNIGDHAVALSAGYSTPNVGTYAALLTWTNGAIQSQLYEGYSEFYNQVY